jgi:hypothetical protein
MRKRHGREKAVCTSASGRRKPSPRLGFPV